MISAQHRCIFIHQRKCAGTAVILAFGLQLDDPDWRYMNEGVQSREYAERPSDYFVFAVVRNPWDRFVSGWKYCDSTRGRTLRDVLLDPPLEGHDYRHLTRPQSDTLVDAQGRLVVDFLMRYETIQRDFDQVCDRIGKARVALARVNVGAHGGYRSYFDVECQTLFERRYAGDIERFGYRY